MAAIQGFFMYSINAISVGTTVSVCYRAGVHNSGVSVRRGSTVVCLHISVVNIIALHTHHTHTHTHTGAIRALAQCLCSFTMECMWFGVQV